MRLHYAKRRKLLTLAATDVPINEAAFLAGVPFSTAYAYIGTRRRKFAGHTDYLDYLARKRGYRSHAEYVYALIKERNGSRGR